MGKNIIFLVYILFFSSSCQIERQLENKNQQTESPDWQIVLKDKMPLLGHRNWIVVTDMAYPLQSKEGIITLFAEESYPEVLAFVNTLINESSHVYAHIYWDKELSFLVEEDTPGIDLLRNEMRNILQDEILCVEHEELIKKLDEMSRIYQVVIIKTRLTIPYTSTFFELDCGYWDMKRQNKLDQQMNVQ